MCILYSAQVKQHNGIVYLNSTRRHCVPVRQLVHYGNVVYNLFVVEPISGVVDCAEGALQDGSHQGAAAAGVPGGDGASYHVVPVHHTNVQVHYHSQFTVSPLNSVSH